VHVHAAIREQQRTHGPAEAERRHHAQHRDEQRDGPDLEHVAHRRFEANLEEEDDHAQPGKDVDARVSFDRLEPADADQIEVAQEDAGDELTEDGRLAEADGNVAGNFCGGEDNRQREDDLGDGIGVGEQGCSWLMP
jgi:hypothetical protein